jgi:hypothetical protein
MDAEPDSLVAVMQSKLINEVRRIARTLHVARLQRRVCLPFLSNVSCAALCTGLSTTMIYTHVSRNAASGVESPLDRL